MILPVASLIFYSIPIKSSLHPLPMRSSLYFMPRRKSLDILLGMNNLSEFPFDESLYVNELSLCHLIFLRALGFYVGFGVG
jgi:hypothetical protein